MIDIDKLTADSELFRAISLSTLPFAHEDADPILAALAARGWEISTQGNQRSGEVVITVRKKVG